MTAAQPHALARSDDLLAPRPLPSWGAPELDELRRAVSGEQVEVDVVVVGAGITGAGVARDLAMRGYSVLVLEKDDVAFGTSSRSTRLIHGGVRYLEQGQIGLVYEALRERASLYRLASHLVTPARFLFPAYRGDRLAPWKLRIGLTMYDALAMYRGSTHRGLSAAGTLEREPLLRGEELRGAVEYEDAVTDDARLTLAVLQDARRFGARVLTRAQVAKITSEPGSGRPPHRVHLEDGGTVRASAVVLAMGPWTNERLLGDAGRGLLALSKGVHVVFEASDVPVRQPLVVQVRGERRILFVVPWGTRTYVGTTDTHYEGDPGASCSDESDERDVVELASRVLRVELDPSRIVSAWSGVRPLVRAPGRGSTVELARTHRIVTREPGVFAIVGGKLTTYRAMAQEAAEVVQRRLVAIDHPRARSASRCKTLARPLVPGAPLTEAERADPLLVDLWPRHGADARTLAELARGTRDEGRIVADLPYRWVEVEHALTHEGCLHVEDVLRRRLPLALTDHALGGHAARRIAERLAALRGETDPGWIEAEISRYSDAVAAETRRRPST